jgi:hypothetical protein
VEETGEDESNEIVIIVKDRSFARLDAIHVSSHAAALLYISRLRDFIDWPSCRYTTIQSCIAEPGSIQN